MGGIVSSLQSQAGASTPGSAAQQAAAPGTASKVHFAEPVAQDATPAAGAQPALGSALKRSSRRAAHQTDRRLAGQPVGLPSSSIAAVGAPAAGPSAQPAAAAGRAKPGPKRGPGRPPQSKAAKKTPKAPAAAAAAASPAGRPRRPSTPAVKKNATKRVAKRQLQSVEPTVQKKRGPGRPRKHPVQ